MKEIYEKLVEVYRPLKKNLHLCHFPIHPHKTQMFTDFWDAFYFKHFCLLSDEVMNIQICELTDDRASSSLQGHTKMRGEFIREIRDFESFYNCKYNYRDQDEMQRRIERVKAKLLWDHRLSSYATYLQTCTNFPKVTDLDICSCCYVDRSPGIPTAPFSIIGPMFSKLKP